MTADQIFGCDVYNAAVPSAAIYDTLIPPLPKASRDRTAKQDDWADHLDGTISDRALEETESGAPLTDNHRASH